MTHRRAEHGTLPERPQVIWTLALRNRGCVVEGGSGDGGVLSYREHSRLSGRHRTLPRCLRLRSKESLGSLCETSRLPPLRSVLVSYYNAEKSRLAVSRRSEHSTGRGPKPCKQLTAVSELCHRQPGIVTAMRPPPVTPRLVHESSSQRRFRSTTSAMTSCMVIVGPPWARRGTATAPAGHRKGPRAASDLLTGRFPRAPPRLLAMLEGTGPGRRSHPSGADGTTGEPDAWHR